jgi:hypothetical protein
MRVLDGMFTGRRQPVLASIPLLTQRFAYEEIKRVLDRVMISSPVLGQKTLVNQRSGFARFHAHDARPCIMYHASRVGPI